MGERQATAGRASEPFASVPFRVFEALQRRELSPRQAQLVQHLIYRCYRDRGETAATIAQLKDEIGLSCVQELIRQDLHAIHEKGWVQAGSPGTSRKPWRFTLASANVARGEKDDLPSHFQPDFQIDGPPDLEVSSNRFEVAKPSTRLHLVGSGSPPLASLGSPKNVEERERKEVVASTVARDQGTTIERELDFPTKKHKIYFNRCRMSFLGRPPSTEEEATNRLRAVCERYVGHYVLGEVMDAIRARVLSEWQSTRNEAHLAA